RDRRARHRPRAAHLGGEAEPLRPRPQRAAAGAVRTGGGAGMRARGAFRHRTRGAEVRPCAGAAVRRERTRLPARRFFRRPGAGRGHAVHRAPRGRAVQVRMVAVRRHHLPLAHRFDLGQRRAGLGWRCAGRLAGGPAPGVRTLRSGRGARAWTLVFAAGAVLATGVAGSPPVLADALAPLDAPTQDQRVVFPASVTQGAMVIGKVPPGSTVEYAGRRLRTTGYGTAVFGVGRDTTGPLSVRVIRPDGSSEQVRIPVAPRDWPLQRVDGVPRKTVDPPPATAERIRREQARVAEARLRDDARTDFTAAFVRPVEGRISGRFGRARVYNGKPGAPHSGMDIAAASGTPVKAPAAG